MKEGTHRIVALQASNIKKLTAVSITPEKNVITLTGANGAGKSSVLDAISFALGGRDAICEQPLRRGASKGEVVCQLNGLIVTRKFTTTGTTLNVTTEDGMPQKSPQAILDSLVGNLAFDPLAFARMEPRVQLETLRKLVGLDFSQQDIERARIYQDRTFVNRERDIAKNRLTGIQFDESAPKEEVSVSELVSKLEAAERTNRANADFRRDLETANTRVLEYKSLVGQLEDELEKLKNRINAAKESHHQAEAIYKTAKAKVDALKDADTAELRKQIESAGAVNGRVQRNKQHQQIKSEVAKAEEKSNALSRQIEAIDAAKTQAMAKAKFPLPELSFDDSGVILNGFPFKQASSGEQLRASVAVGMALNPRLKVIFIRDGSLLDDGGLKTIADMASTNDYQVWLEDARSIDPTAVVIEDGHVKES